MIRFHQKVGGALAPRPSRRPFDRLRTGAGRSHIQIISSVNSPAGNGYGSTSMDCRHPLRNCVRRVASLQRETHAAAARASGSLANAHDGAGESRHRRFAERFHAASLRGVAIAFAG